MSYKTPDQVDPEGLNQNSTVKSVVPNGSAKPTKPFGAAKFNAVSLKHGSAKSGWGMVTKVPQSAPVADAVTVGTQLAVGAALQLQSTTFTVKVRTVVSGVLWLSVPLMVTV